jgi:hypothetical protein
MAKKNHYGFVKSGSGLYEIECLQRILAGVHQSIASAGKAMNLSVDALTVAVSILVVWRISHLFWGEDGPWKLLARFRRRLGDSFAGQLLDCFYCLSVWVAAPLAWWIGPTWEDRVLLWPALSAGAILIERVTARPVPPPPAVWQEQSLEDSQRSHSAHKEASHVVLR